MRDFARKIADINRFFKTFRISRSGLAGIGLLMAVQAGAEAFSASLLIPFLNSLQGAGSPKDSNTLVSLLDRLFASVPEDQRFVTILASIVLIMSAVQFMVIFNNRLILRFAMFKVQYASSVLLFHDILRARLKFFYSKRSGDLINALTMDVNRSFNCLNNLLLMCTHACFALGYLTAGFLLLPKYTAMLLGGFLAFSLSLKRLFRYIYSLGQRNVRAQEDANNIVVESMQGIRSITLSCAQDKYRDKFAEVMHRFFYTIYRSSWVTTSLPYFIRFMALTAIGLVLYANRAKLTGGDPTVFSKIMFFALVTAAMFRYLGAMKTVSSSFAFNHEGVVNLLRLSNDLARHEADEAKGGKTVSGINESLDAHNLCFSYKPGTPVLHGLDFSIKCNSKTAFVGTSGSGKSTLVDILSGFHDDYDGKLMLDGVELRDIGRSSWRGMLGYVSQETFIFNDTVRNNLTFGFDRDFSDEEVESACAKAQVLDTIHALENGFQTRLGERGVRLSGGEKQRLAIARLFLKQPQIVFLDEATSALDSESEKKVKEALDTLAEGRTVIAVAHRLSTIADFDTIHVMREGRIVESGSHAELIAQKGHYHKFFTIQSMGDNGAE